METKEKGMGGERDEGKVGAVVILLKNVTYLNIYSGSIHYNILH